MGSCWGNRDAIFPAEKNHVGIGALEKNMLLILDIISIIQVTCGGVALISMSLSQNVGCEHKV